MLIEPEDMLLAGLYRLENTKQENKSWNIISRRNATIQSGNSYNGKTSRRPLNYGDPGSAGFSYILRLVTLA